MVKPFWATVGAASDEAVTDEAAPLSPPLVSPALASGVDETLEPPRLMLQAVSIPSERMETNKVFLFIFVFRGSAKPLLFLSECHASYESESP